MWAIFEGVNRMGFIYEDEELELTYKGTTYKFRAPSAFEQQEVLRTFKQTEENQKQGDGIQIYIDFFVNLGLTEEVLKKMSLKGLLDLFSYSVGSKKN